jgi:NADH oxidase (H2O2-forming)
MELRRELGTMKIVMIGAGGGVIAASNTLRLLGSDAEIDIFTKRDRAAYTPCEFPYVLRQALPSFDDIFYVGASWFEKKRLRLHVNTEVTDINARQKYVVARGEKFPYDKAIIDTGSTNFVPPLKGLDGEREYYLNTDILEARRIEDAISKYKSAIIIGAGPIGLEMAESFKVRGFQKIFVLEALNHILPKVLDQEMAEILRSKFENAGIEIIAGAQIEGVEREGDKKTVVLPDRRVVADFILLSTGVRPNVFLAHRAGLAVGPTGGIIVNEYLQTSDLNIYAVGDCVEGWDLMTNRKTLCALATFTNRTGRIVARNIALGNKFPFIGTLTPFGGQFFGTYVATAGYTESQAQKMGLGVLSVVHNGITHNRKLGGRPIVLKLVVQKKSQAVVGAQIIGDETVGRIMDRLIISIGEKIPISKLSQYETVYSPTLNNSYDVVTNAIDILVGKILSKGEELRPS